MPAYGRSPVGTAVEYGQAGGRSQEDASFFRQQADNAQARHGIEAPVYGQGVQDARAREQATRAQQMGGLGMLNQAAQSGYAQTQQLAGTQAREAVAAQQAMASSARGAQAMALAGGSAQANASAARAQIAGGMQAQQAADMAQARGMALDAAGQMRQSDLAAQQEAIRNATYQAGWTQQQRAANDAYQLGMTGNEIAVNTQAQNAQNAAVRSEQQYDVARQNAETQRYQQNMQKAGSLFSAAGGAIAGFSDERTKESVQTARGGQVAEMLRAFDGAEYEYKPEYRDRPEGGRGKQFGPASAQRIASTALGKAVAKPGDDGLLRIDGMGAIKALMAGTAHLQREVDRLKKGGK